MHTIEIAKQDWSRALDAFSHTHEGVNVSVFGELDSGLSRPINLLPLRGVVFESTSEDSTITIAASRLDGEHVTHVIHQPTHVQIERTDSGVDVALDIESRDGAVVMVRPRSEPRIVGHLRDDGD